MSRGDLGKPLKWEPGLYRISEFIVLRPLDPAARNVARERFEIIVRGSPPYWSSHTYEVLSDPPSDQQIKTPQGMRMNGNGKTQIGIEGLKISQESWTKVTGPFEARADRVNEWAVTLPDELVKAVRERLKTAVTKAHP
jgi:hypothetical protein